MADTKLSELRAVQSDGVYSEVQFQYFWTNFPSIEQRDFTCDFRTTCPTLPTQWRLTIKLKAFKDGVVACAIHMKRLDLKEGLVRGEFGLDLLHASVSNQGRTCLSTGFTIHGMSSGQEVEKTLYPVLTIDRMSYFATGQLIVKATLRISDFYSTTKQNCPCHSRHQPANEELELVWNNCRNTVKLQKPYESPVNSQWSTLYSVCSATIKFFKTMIRFAVSAKHKAALGYTPERQALDYRPNYENFTPIKSKF